MRTAGATATATLVGILAVICCAGPLLIAAIGTTALAAWLSNSGYVLIAAALIAVGGGVLWLRRRRVSAQDCYWPEALNKASKHE
jgi:Na+/melibiose symporter-like transporter